jgi:hypothetical protein
MSTNVIILISVFVGVGALVGAAYLGAFLTKKNVNVEKIEKTVDDVTQFITNAMLALAPFIPGQYASELTKIALIVANVVKKIEDLFNLNLIPADQRKANAIKLISADLTSVGITVDDNVKKLVSVAIDAACLVLPHHIEASTTTATNTTAQ